MYGYDVPIEDSRFGKAFRCECQTAKIEQARILRAGVADGIMSRYAGLTLGTFVDRCGGNLAGKECLFDLVAQGIEGDLAPLPGALLHGDFGTGKTGAAALILSAHVKRGETALCIDWRDFCYQVQDTYRKTSGKSRLDLITTITTPRWLLIDELGSLNQAESRDKQTIFEEVIRARHSRDLPTLITTNLSPNQLVSHFGQYAMERVGELCSVIHVGGVSLRFT